MFETVLGWLMMQMNKEAVKEDDTNAIHVEVEDAVEEGRRSQAVSRCSSEA